MFEGILCLSLGVMTEKIIEKKEMKRRRTIEKWEERNKKQDGGG